MNAFLDFTEPERYELYESPTWETDRREFFRVAGAGLAVALLVCRDAGAQQRGGRGGGPREIAAWLHVGEDSQVSDFAYVVLDDGKGRSLVQINVQPGMADVADTLFGADAETLPDGTKVATRQEPGEKGGAGVVMWTVDTLRTDGLRVVISAFNSGAQHTAATREAPALTMAQLREIATSERWKSLD